MKIAVGMTNTAKHTCHIVAPPDWNHSTATGAAESFCGRCWQGPVSSYHGAARRIEGLTIGWYWSILFVGSETASAAQAKNIKEAMITGSHHPPAVTVGAGGFVWCRKLYGLDEV